MDDGAERSEEYVVAIDLGSNTLRVTKLDCRSGKFVNEYEKIVKTADMLERTGVIHHEAVDRVIYAIKEAQKQIGFSDASIRAVTTEAIRRAHNRVDVLARIRKETGVSFEVITGEEEAKLTLLAVKHRLEKLHFAARDFVLIDIGGGSTELIFRYGEEVFSKSFPVGIVTIAQRYETLEQIETALPEVMLDIQMYCAEVYATKGRPEAFIATAGTPTTVAAMKLGQTYENYDAKKINGTSLKQEELDLYLKKLLSMPFEEREIMVGTGRSDLITAGILIFKEIYNIVEFESCVVIDDGLREGVALDSCKE
ncbi:phosphatase [Sulfurovum sp. NBC37-1]|uniref:Ppx/GppA phosphatase family protein n=1 Tax=Sulfurovum sp. (strain NBC37-1) TaxID=387093 RepID=UPI0001587AE8|nr:phosphatase [Sulfurovum sp. NBC37-1]BAF72773.1 phosphatase, Ppx/GppA family [Sulfurovum sp. NBC37-1]